MALSGSIHLRHSPVGTSVGLAARGLVFAAGSADLGFDGELDPAALLDGEREIHCLRLKGEVAVTVTHIPQVSIRQFGIFLAAWEPEAVLEGRVLSGVAGGDALPLLIKRGGNLQELEQLTL